MRPSTEAAIGGEISGRFELEPKRRGELILPMIEEVLAAGIGKRFGDRLLIDDLSFSLPRGGAGVIGPNILRVGSYETPSRAYVGRFNQGPGPAEARRRPLGRRA